MLKKGNGKIYFLSALTVISYKDCSCLYIHKLILICIYILACILDITVLPKCVPAF